MNVTRSWLKKLGEEELRDLIKAQSELDDVPVDLYNYTSQKIDEKIASLKQRKNLGTTLKEMLAANRPWLRYAFSFMLVAAIFCLFILAFLWKSQFDQPGPAYYFVQSITGEAYSIDEPTGKIKRLHPNEKLGQANTIITGTKSLIRFKIDKIEINLKEKSRMELTEIDETAKIKFNYGEASFKVSNMEKNALFSLETEVIIVETQNAEFTVSSSINESTVQVKKGSIYMVPRMQNEKKSLIDTLDKGLAEEINNIIYKKTIIDKNQSIYFSRNTLNRLDNEISEILISITSEARENKINQEKTQKYLNKLSNAREEIIKTSIPKAKVIPEETTPDDKDSSTVSPEPEPEVRAKMESEDKNGEKYEIIIFKVNSILGWQDTGINISSNSRVLISYKGGTWCMIRGAQFVDAQGYYSDKDKKNIIANINPINQKVAPGALLGRIGNGDSFGIGNQIEISNSPQNGKLYVRINDSDYWLSDNSGMIVIQIIILSP